MSNSKSFLALATTLSLAACGDGSPDPDPQPGAVDSIEVAAPTTQLTAGDQLQLTARAFDADGQLLAGQAFTWATDDAGVATVTDGGMVTAVAAGEVIVWAGAGMVTGGVFFTVAEDLAPIARLELSHDDAVALWPSHTLALTATAYDADGEVLPGRALTWETSDASVATVSADGEVTAVGPGSAQIAVAGEGQRDELTVEVPAASDLALTALGDAALPTLLGRYTEVVPDLGTVTRTLRAIDGRLAIDHVGQTYAIELRTISSSELQPASVPLVVRYTSEGSLSWDAATQTYTFQPEAGAAFTGQRLAGGLQVRWQPEPRTAGPSTFVWSQG